MFPSWWSKEKHLPTCYLSHKHSHKQIHKNNNCNSKTAYLRNKITQESADYNISTEVAFAIKRRFRILKFQKISPGELLVL